MTEPIRSSQSGLPGLIRKKNPGTGNSGTGSIYRKSLQAPGPGSGSLPGSVSSGTTRAAQLTGTIRKVVTESIEDSNPVAAMKRLSKSDESVTVSPTYETGGILATLQTGFKNYLPLILVVGAVVIGIVVIKSAGKK
jgi:hypothetical protein